MHSVDEFIRADLEDAARRREIRENCERLGLPHANGVQTLYKYRSLQPDSRAYTIDIIENHRLFFPRPDQLNDPFDCSPRFKLDGNPNDQQFVDSLLGHQKEMEKGKPAEYLEQLRQSEGVPVTELAAALGDRLRRDLIDSTRVLSLSAEPLHPLLWSHYASNHTGLCFHFSTEPGRFFGLARKVEYHEDRPPILINAQTPDADEMVRIMTLTKARFWSYEHEYRISGLNGEPVGEGYIFDDSGRVSFERHLLTGVTLGMLTSAKDAADLLALAQSSKPQLPVWKAKMHPEKFWMEAERIG